MASIKRRTWIGRGKVGYGFQAQVRQKGYPALSKLFGTRSEALKWSKEIEAKLLLDPEVKKAEGVTVADLLKRYPTEVTSRKRGKEPERCRLSKRRLSGGVETSASRNAHRLVWVIGGFERLL